jgi:HEAT repeat protein
VADFAAKPANIDNLYAQGVLKQLRPLLLDPTVSIQNSAALALGRIANHSPELAEAVVTN